jgi:threonine synthase
MVFGCPACARGGTVSVVEVDYHWEDAPRPPWDPARPIGTNRYTDLLPGSPESDRITLGEGGTPLLLSRVIGPSLGLRRLYFKNETVNPTWSFKDRYVAVTVDAARRFGYRQAVVSSTGNLGVSAAAYCAAAGLRCLFLAPPETSSLFLDHARLHGAQVLVTTWEGRQPVFEYLARERDWFPVGLFLPRPVHNPFGIEGYRLIAYELLAELREPPAAVLFPCARGNGLYGTWKGFVDARQFGWTTLTPAMIACQPAGADSLEVSLRAGSAWVLELPPADSVAVSTRETVADTRALEAIRASGGTALSATDVDILAAVRELGREGLCVEASSALPVACLRRLMEADLVDRDAPIVCVLTAAGIKWPEHMVSRAPTPGPVEPTPEAVDRYLASVGAVS